MTKTSSKTLRIFYSKDNEYMTQRIDCNQIDAEDGFFRLYQNNVKVFEVAFSSLYGVEEL